MLINDLKKFALEFTLLILDLLSNLSQSHNSENNLSMQNLYSKYPADADIYLADAANYPIW